MGRFGEAEELVGALIWLASDASRFVTGTVVVVDGDFKPIQVSKGINVTSVHFAQKSGVFI